MLEFWVVPLRVLPERLTLLTTEPSLRVMDWRVPKGTPPEMPPLVK